MGRVSGKKALITGGAQGLGEATARMLAREGAKVAVTDVNGAGADKVAAAINVEFGEGTAFAWQHDVTDAERWQVVLKEAHDAMGDGGIRRTSFEEKSTQFRRSIYVVEDVKKGDAFTAQNIRRIRPGNGLSPDCYDAALQSHAAADIAAGTPLEESHLE